MRAVSRPPAFPLVLGVLLALLVPVGASSAVAQPTVDGDLSDAGYVTIATRANTNDGFGDRTEVREIVYHADDVNDVLYVGIKGKLPTGNTNGIGLWLNLQALSGTSAGTALGSDVSGASHYLDGQGAGSSDDYKADFEVDYLVAMSSGATSDEVFYYGLERVGGTAGNNFGSSDQSGGTTSHSFFGGTDATFAFHNGGGSNQGFEMKVPYAALGDGVFEIGAMEAFAVVADSDGSFSDETVPGDVQTGNPGTNPDFSALTGGPYHGSKLFTSGSAGDWTATATWSGGMVPFDGADVKIDSDVTLDTDAFVHDLTIASNSTFTASDGNGRTLTLKHGGAFTRNGDFFPDDGTIEVAGSGTVSVPNELGVSEKLNDVTIREGTLELQDFIIMDGVLTVHTFGTFRQSSSNKITINNDVIVDGTLTLSPAGSNLRIDDGDLTVKGTLDGNGKVNFAGGNSNSVIGGSTDPITFSSVEFDKGGKDVTLNTGVEVSEEMKLQSGTVNTNGNSLTLLSTATQTAAIRPLGTGQVNGDVTFERHVAMSSDASHFRFLSAPTTTKLDDEGSGSNAGSLLSNMWTQSESGTGADAHVSADNASVYAYNEAADLNDTGTDLSNGWEAIGQSSGNWGELNDLTGLSGQTNIDPGRGFLVYLFADRDFDNTDEGFPLTLTATGPVQANENSGNSITPPITFTGSDGDDPANNGWNLIANPFMAPIDWEAIESDGSDLTNVDATIYVWDAGNGKYATYTADPSGSNGSTGGSDDQGRNIAPFQAFFVKATGSTPSIGGIEGRGEKNLNGNPGLKTKPSGGESPRIALRLRGAGDSSGETTALRFTEDAAPGKDAYDAYQLTPLSTTYALVASEMGGTDALFDHQSRPVPAAQDTIDLAFEITEGGTYTLGADTLAGLPADWNVILENVDSGARYDLGAGETVTFDYTAPKSAGASGSSAIERMLKQGAPTVAKAAADSAGPSFRLFVGPKAALPVELAGVEAALRDDRSVQLTWQTASETNNAGFAVERSIGGREGGSERAWTQVGFVEGRGTTDRRQRYRFVDEEVPYEAETLTYRLRQEDLDGRTSYSDRVAVEIGVPRRVQLHAPFPNPARRRITLRYEVPNRTQGADVRIALYDVLGRRVRTLVQGSAEAGRHETMVSTRSLAPGTYFVRMQVDGHPKTRRLTVVR